MSTLQIHHRASRASQVWADGVRTPRPNRATALPASNVTHYEFGPFGELLRATGPMAKLNPFRFSTKYQDDETDLVYYGYRYYNASTGRWLSRDPIEEQGGLNLYGFVRNNAINNRDFIGLTTETAVDGIKVFDQGKTISLTWPKDKTCCAGRNIGDLVNIFSIIDATKTESLNDSDPEYINKMQEALNISALGTASLNTPAYIGAGMAIVYAPNKWGKACCPNPKFVAEKSGTIYGWNSDGTFSGSSWVDFPGTTVSGFFPRNFSRKYRLHFYCDDTLIRTLNWSYSASFSWEKGVATVTMTTPF